MSVLKPTRNKLYLSLFLWLNIFFTYGLLYYQGSYIYDIIAGYVPTHYSSLFFLVTMLFSYIIACIVTIKLPQFWQPTLLKTVLALLFELALYAAFIFIYNNIDTSTISPGTQPP